MTAHTETIQHGRSARGNFWMADYPRIIAEPFKIGVNELVGEYGCQAKTYHLKIGQP